MEKENGAKEGSAAGDGAAGDLIFAVSAPSGTGKTTLCKMLSDEFSDVKPSVSYTTRARRDGETDGVSYHFVDGAVFDDMVSKGLFIEWANVFGKKYGTAFKSVMEGAGSSDVLLEIDVQGVENLLNVYRNGDFGGSRRLVTVFIVPPSIGHLSERLKKRGGMDGDELLRRVGIAEAEMGKSFMYDYVVTNDVLKDAYLKLKSIVIAERCKNRNKIK